jgi:two-component system, cell cycle sensor histidine kinase and response regulator CckA
MGESPPPPSTGSLSSMPATMTSDAVAAQVFKNVNDAVIVLDMDLSIQAWNPAAERMYGWKATEVVGKTVATVLQTRFFEGQTRKATLATLEQDDVWTGLVAHRHRDGHEILIESAVGYLRNADGEITGFVGINRDVSAREAALAGERAAQRRLATLAEFSTALTDSLDLETRLVTIARGMVSALADWCAIDLVVADGAIQRVAIVSADPAQQALADELRGYTADPNGAGATATVLRTGKAILLPTISDAMLALAVPEPRYQKLLGATGAASGMLVPMIARGKSLGAILYMRNEARAPFTDDDLTFAEELARRAAIAIDNARLYEAAETAVRQKDQALAQLDTVLTSATIGVAFFDATLHVVQVNATLAAMTGRDAAALLGCTVYDFMPNIADAQQALLQHVLTTGQPIIDVELIVPEGRVARPGTYLLSYYPISTTAGSPTGVGVVTFDISDRRKLEQQLIQAQKMEAIGRLAGGVAHDFNNLLTVISGATEMVVELIPPDHPAQDDLAQVTSASRRAAGLTRQLLAFARKQHLEPRVVQLNDRLRETELLLRRLIGEDITLQTHLAADLPLVLVDLQQLDQVVINLAINARDAMPDGGALLIETMMVTVEGPGTYAQVQLPLGTYVRIAVTDTGVGMPPAVRDRVFEPFFTTKGPDKGSGLGLAMCYGIIKQHGGFIWVYSEEGQGTTISVYLPAVVGDAAETAPPVLASALRGGTETILVVEDEDAVRAFVVRVLRELGYTVYEAARASAALEQAATAPIELLLTDIVMPGMSGVELAAEVRTHWPTVRVVYMSGYTAHASLDQERLPVGATLLHKPFGRIDLARIVRTVLDQ